MGGQPQRCQTRTPEGAGGHGTQTGQAGGTEGWHWWRHRQGEGRAAAVPAWLPATPHSSSRIWCHPAEEDYGNFPPPLRIIFRLGCSRGCAERLGDGNVICDSIISSCLPSFFFPCETFIKICRSN